MTINEILKRYKTTLDELLPLYEKFNESGKLDLSDNNIYMAISFVSKINGLVSIFSDEFIKENNLKQVVDWINKKNIMIQAAHYDDKSLFYDYIENIYSQLKYRYSQISYRYSLSKEEQNKLIITPEYQVYLYNLIKYYLEKNNTKEVQNNLKEILSVTNLYRVNDEKDLICLGSKVTFMDTISNEIQYFRIVLDSHEKIEHHKLGLTKAKFLLNHRIGDIITYDYASSCFIRILDVQNEEEKPDF